MSLQKPRGGLQCSYTGMPDCAEALDMGSRPDLMGLGEGVNQSVNIFPAKDVGYLDSTQKGVGGVSSGSSRWNPVFLKNK